MNEKQTFGYLRAPIYVNYYFYDWSKANFYLSLGAMVQKDVYYTSQLQNKLNDVYVIRELLYSEPAYLKKSISQSNWQFSEHFSVGVSYPIIRKLNIISSVGRVYYFDDSNEYRTIFSDKKLQLDLSIGMKIDF